MMKWFTEIEDPSVQFFVIVGAVILGGICVSGSLGIFQTIYKQPVQIVCFEGKQYTIDKNSELKPIFISKDGTKIQVSCP